MFAGRLVIQKMWTILKGGEEPDPLEKRRKLDDREGSSAVGIQKNKKQKNNIVSCEICRHYWKDNSSAFVVGAQILNRKQ